MPNEALNILAAVLYFIVAIVLTICKSALLGTSFELIAQGLSSDVPIGSWFWSLVLGVRESDWP